MALLIGEEDVRKLLTLEDTLECLEDAYEQYGLRRVRNPVRRELRTNSLEGDDLPQEEAQDQGISMNFAYMDKYRLAIIKVFTKFKDWKLLTHLIDTREAQTLAIFNSTWESYMRVGAEGAIGAKYLSRKDASTLGVLGTGAVGKLLFPFLLKVRNFKKAYCHAGRLEDQPLAKEYARQMQETYGLEVTPAEEIEELVRASDVLVSSTRATRPIVRSEWIKPGTHITGIGADSPTKAEYEPQVFRKIDKIVIDYQLALETGQMKDAFKAGVISEKDIYGDIGEIVAGVKPGRTADSEITGYFCTGMTIGYVAILKRLYEKARSQGMGIDTRGLQAPAPLLAYLCFT